MNVSVTARTRVAGVVGSPIAHSLSPLIHNAWIAVAGLDAVYVALPVRPDRFPGFCDSLRGGALRGLNVTAPFKEAALTVADAASPRATAAGSANVLIFADDGRVWADSTDGEGLLWAFRTQAPSFDPAAGASLVLGAGGAARAAAAALLDAGAPAVGIRNRTREAADVVARALGPRVLAAASWPAALGSINAIVNATPGRAEGALDSDGLSDATVVMDMVYRPLVTPLLAQAKARGLRAVDGLAMLIGQAAPSFRALFGVDPPAVDVRALAEAACSPSA